MLDVSGGERPLRDAGPELLFFAPFVSSLMRVEPGWIDYNGHLNMAYYNVLFDHAVDEAFALCGLGPEYAKARGASFFIVESRMRYRRELSLRDRVRVTLHLLAVDDKRMHYGMEIREATDGWLAAACENISIHVNMASRKAAPFPADIRENLDAMRRAHAALPAPEWTGEGVRMPSKARVN
jgi:acyl-CoA thioester hydrolase